MEQARKEFETQLLEAKKQIQEIQNSYDEEKIHHKQTKEILNNESNELQNRMKQAILQLQQCEEELKTKSKDLIKCQGDLSRLSQYNESLLSAVLEKAPHVLESVASSSY